MTMINDQRSLATGDVTTISRCDWLTTKTGTAQPGYMIEAHITERHDIDTD